ncbi:DUF3332 family protein [Aliagarivorans marinus]|uniref:DUF3332 family protein n=1 Tax=Aliagarivorans marinus TaxID=561965 RepID=UPI00041D2E08|nr:DUF3332 family protein [Aliagarivorans marinus]
MRLKDLKKMGLALVLPGLLSGCVGSNVLTGMLLEKNVEAVDNRYARGGLNIALSPVYAFTLMGDAMVLNSIEFWTGTHPITGSPHVFDSDVDTWLEVNDMVDEPLRSAPLPPLSLAE